jgi:hypothetical protein
MKTLIALLLFSSAAFGQATEYSYSTNFPMRYSDQAGIHTSVPLTAHLVLAQPLAANLQNASVTPLSWSAWNPIAHPDQAALFQFSTDSNGNITAWHFFAVGFDLTSMTIVASSSDSALGDIETADVGGVNHYQYGANAGLGSWSAAAATAQQTVQVAATPTIEDQLAAAQAQITSLQKQLTHVTSEMIFYRNGTINWEAEALGWQAMAYRCKASKGVC